MRRNLARGLPVLRVHLELAFGILRADQEPGPAREAELAELRAELREGLDELPEAQARVLVLKDALGFSFTEIAAVTDLPIGTAKCYAHRGRTSLRRQLAQA